MAKRKGLSKAWRVAFAMSPDARDFAEVKRYNANSEKHADKIPDYSEGADYVPGYAKNLHRNLRDFNRHADLMDCREVDKFFPGERKFVPVPKRNKAPNLTLETARLLMQSGGHIIDDGLHRQVYFAGKLHGHINAGVLSVLENSGLISKKRIPNSHNFEWRKAVSNGDR